ncbi:unnamed protein product [Urochloa humidicola]
MRRPNRSARRESQSTGGERRDRVTGAFWSDRSIKRKRGRSDDQTLNPPRPRLLFAAAASQRGARTASPLDAVGGHLIPLVLRRVPQLLHSPDAAVSQEARYGPSAKLKGGRFVVGASFLLLFQFVEESFWWNCTDFRLRDGLI